MSSLGRAEAFQEFADQFLLLLVQFFCHRGNVKCLGDGWSIVRMQISMKLETVW